jgi:hypothetical protein
MVFVMWHPKLSDWLEQSATLRFIYWLFPALIGYKAMMCLTCNMISYQSTVSGWVAGIVNLLTGINPDEDMASMLVVGYGPVPKEGADHG